MNIYIAGKITDLDEAEAHELFSAAENLVCHFEHTPLNPMKLVDQTPGRKYGEYLADALQILLTQADAVYFLENWTLSKGAKIEHKIARELDLPIWYHFQHKAIERDWSRAK